MSGEAFAAHVLRVALGLARRDEPRPPLPPIPPAFGVFCGVTRSEKHRLGEGNWPDDIHGSQGRWRSFAPATPEQLRQWAYDSGHDAVNKDDRRDHFPPLETDPDAVFDVKFMLVPAMPIDERWRLPNGERFKNRTLGIVVADRGVPRATFLPGVFPNKHPDYIKERLLRKAGLRQDANAKLFAYKTERLAVRVGDVLNSYCVLCGSSLYLVPRSPRERMEDALSAFGRWAGTAAASKVGFPRVPYAYANQRVIWEDSPVRNAGTAFTLLQLDEINLLEPRDAARDAVVQDVLAYTGRFLDAPSRHRQSAAFLLPSLRLLGATELADGVRDMLLDDVVYNKINIEPAFELGEILWALGRDGVDTSAHVRALRSPESVFEINWQAQAAAPRDDANEKQHALHVMLYETVKSWDLGEKETNFLAVAFEAAAALSVADGPLFQAVARALVDRLDRDTGLYRFLDGTARVDITGHVVNALVS
jgi:hypothetical protein